LSAAAAPRFKIEEGRFKTSRSFSSSIFPLPLKERPLAHARRRQRARKIGCGSAANDAE
jgi:hypothetical protein